MNRKSKLARSIKVEISSLHTSSLQGQLSLAEIITRDANELAGLIIEEEVSMLEYNKKDSFYDQVLDLLTEGMFDFENGSDAAHALRIAAHIAYTNPTTTLKEQIEIHCGPHVRNLARMVS